MPSGRIEFSLRPNLWYTFDGWPLGEERAKKHRRVYRSFNIRPATITDRFLFCRKVVTSDAVLSTADRRYCDSSQHVSLYTTVCWMMS